MPATLEISSRDNTNLKEARRIRDGKQRDRIFIEGARLLMEAARSGLELEMIFVSKDGMSRAAEILERKISGEIYHVSNSAFDSIADTVSSQGLVAIARRPAAGRTELEKGIANSSVPVIAFLHQTNNPANLGAVIRTAEAAGAGGLIVSARSADAFSPKALRAAMGSTFRFPVWTDAELGEALDWARENDIQTVATEIGATRSYTEVDWTGPKMLLLGSEAHGLSKAELPAVDEKIMIPMEQPVESLNLAVACGIILFEARRQNSDR